MPQTALLHLPVSEYSSTPLQRSFAIDRPTLWGNGRRPKKKTRTCLVLRNSFRDRKSRCTINHANNANKNLTPISCVFALHEKMDFHRCQRLSKTVVNVTFAEICTHLCLSKYYLRARFADLGNARKCHISI